MEIEIGKKKYTVYVFDSGIEKIDRYRILFKNGDLYSCCADLYFHGDKIENIVTKSIGGNYPPDWSKTDYETYFNYKKRGVVNECLKQNRNNPDKIGIEILDLNCLNHNIITYIRQNIEQ